jgi:hypothetical protein
MVGETELASAMRTLITQPELQARLANAGKSVATQFDWAGISDIFVKTCTELAL